MNPEQFKQAIDFAKNNPDDPRAAELRRRIESGALNNELQAAGMKTFEVKPPPQSAYSTSTASSTEPTAEDTDQGLLSKLKGRYLEGTGGALEQFPMAAAGNMAAQGRMALRGAGAAGRAVGDVAGAVAEGAYKLLPDEVEEQISEKVAPIAEKVAPLVGSVVEKYNLFKEKNPKAAQDFEDIVGVTELLGAGAVAKPLKEVAKPVLKAAGEVVEEGLEKRAARVAVKQAEEVENAVGRILQGSPEDIEVGKRALRNIDTEGVQTYEQLNTRIDDRIGALANKVDSELAKYPEKYKGEQLGKYTKVGDETVVENPVIDAMNGLEDAYTKSGEAVKAAKLRQLKSKLENEGLTVLELNNFAREYGIEFRDKAFTKLGDPKPGYNAENFENIRTSLKNVVRERIPDDVPKELDSQMTDLYKTQDLTKSMEDKVQKLYQKIKNRSLMQKLGGVVADVVDLASLGTMRGFVQKLLPSNVGLKTANSLDLQEELARNLKKIERMLDDKATDAEVLQGVADMLNTAR